MYREIRWTMTCRHPTGHFFFWLVDPRHFFPEEIAPILALKVTV